MTLHEELLSDPLLMAHPGAGICQPDPTWDESRPLLVMLASCHGRQLLTYFNMKPEFRNRFNIVRLETGPIYQQETAGVSVMNRPAMKRLMQSADVLVTYNMGARHMWFALEKVRPMMRPDVRVVTFSAPNCSIFWPVSQNYVGVISVMDALDKGKSCEQIIQEFDQGSFEPLFQLRWRLEMGRIDDRDHTHDVKLAPFITRNFKKVKLFMSAQHPTFITIAWLGAEIIRVLGYAHDTEEQVLSYDYAHDSMAVFPETKYEFKHFGFEYPMRHQQGTVGGSEFYHWLIREAVKFNNAGGYCSIPLD